MFGVVEKGKEKNTDRAVLRPERFTEHVNHTGIPTQLKERLGESTGVSFDDVRVRYNLALPAQLDALAYTQGNRVEIATGQERHLPHELGHVVQQKLGAVRTNASINGLAPNTDERLEREVDSMFRSENPVQKKGLQRNQGQPPVIQRFKFENDSVSGQECVNKENPLELIYNEEISSAYTKWKDGNKQIKAPDRFIWLFLKAYVKSYYKKAQLQVGQQYQVEMDNIIFRVSVEEEDVNIANKINQNQQIWIDLPDYATGDQFTAAAMLLKRPDTSVRINQYKGTFEDCELWKTFKRTLGEVGELVEVHPQKKRGLHILKVNGTPRVVYQSSKDQDTRHTYQQKPGFATGLVGKEYTQDSWSGALRSAWGLKEDVKGLKIEEGYKPEDNPEDERSKIIKVIIEACPALGDVILSPTFKDQNIYIIWLRHSGVTGGAHLEHDTGTAAMKSLVEGLKNNIVILAGSNVGNQVDTLKTAGGNKVFDLTEFWKKEGEVKEFLKGDRFEQVKIYDFFAANAKSVRHIGSRSGNLELMALIGHQVNYIEEKGSYGGERMKSFRESEQLHYERIQVEYPLTFKGNLVRFASILFKGDLKTEFEQKIKSNINNSDVMNIGDVLYKNINDNLENWVKKLEKFGGSSNGNLVENFKKFYESFKDKLTEYLNIESERSKNEGWKSDEFSDLPPYYINIIYPMIYHISKDLKRENGKKYYNKYRGFSETGRNTQITFRTGKEVDGVISGLSTNENNTQSDK
ncbi:MAG: DUF4157 domain-containing protein [Lachnospiraceae bacterium]|nr:DUF4157 domain-containing protein [Lachnospiraceae bacterium]